VAITRARLFPDEQRRHRDMKIRKFYMVEGEFQNIIDPEKIPGVIQEAISWPKGMATIDVKELKVSPFKVHQLVKMAKDNKEKPQGNDENKEAGAGNCDPS
jgi:hypothetical protein